MSTDTTAQATPLWVFFLFSHFYFPASGQAVVTGVAPSPPRFLPSIFIGHRVQQSHCSSIFHRVLLNHALALAASQFVHKKKSQRIYTSMHSAGLKLTKLTYYSRLEDSLIRHRGQPVGYTPIWVTRRQPSRCRDPVLFYSIVSRSPRWFSGFTLEYYKRVFVLEFDSHHDDEI